MFYYGGGAGKKKKKKKKINKGIWTSAQSCRLKRIPQVDFAERRDT
jgi:hypothetical protein